MRTLIVLLLGLLGLTAAAYFVAGRAAGPSIQIVGPGPVLGSTGRLDVLISAPRSALSDARVAFIQAGTETALFSLSSGAKGFELTDEGPAQVRLRGDIGRSNIPALKSGDARIAVVATRSVLYGLRHVTSEATHDVRIRLERPRVSVLSTHHYINSGGSEAIVYRVSPADVASGVMVGDIEYPGFPLAAAHIEGVSVTDPTVHLAFFALRYDQPLNTPMRLFARDGTGETVRADFEFRTFPKASRASRIQITDPFLDRVVPAILAGTTDVDPQGSPIQQFVAINGELRRKNAEKIAAFARETSGEMLWGGVVFHPFTNSSAESAFADHRTYIYEGKEVDRQVHLGFDLASFANTPIVAANRGKVLFAAELGIYGNCVILDHGLGVQSLYGHLSSIEVQPGAVVDKGQPIGRSGMTGLAAGDHLHFTMLVNGQMVNPVEWWDSHWIQDRILRKLQEAR